MKNVANLMIERRWLQAHSVRRSVLADRLCALNVYCLVFLALAEAPLQSLAQVVASSAKFVSGNSGYSGSVYNPSQARAAQIYNNSVNELNANEAAVNAAVNNEEESINNYYQTRDSQYGNEQTDNNDTSAYASPDVTTSSYVPPPDSYAPIQSFSSPPQPSPVVSAPSGDLVAQPGTSTQDSGASVSVEGASQPEHYGVYLSGPDSDYPNGTDSVPSQNQSSQGQLTAYTGMIFAPSPVSDGTGLAMNNLTGYINDTIATLQNLSDQAASDKQSILGGLASSESSAIVGALGSSVTGFSKAVAAWLPSGPKEGVDFLNGIADISRDVGANETAPLLVDSVSTGIAGAQINATVNNALSPMLSDLASAPILVPYQSQNVTIGQGSSILGTANRIAGLTGAAVNGYKTVQSAVAGDDSQTLQNGSALVQNVSTVINQESVAGRLAQSVNGLSQAQQGISAAVQIPQETAALRQIIDTTTETVQQNVNYQAAQDQNVLLFITSDASPAGP
jgi:hypothetical protein